MERMLALLGDSRDEQTQGNTRLTAVSDVTPSSPSTAQHSDAFSGQIYQIQYNARRLLFLKSHYIGEHDFCSLNKIR